MCRSLLFLASTLFLLLHGCFFLASSDCTPLEYSVILLLSCCLPYSFRCMNFIQNREEPNNEAPAGKLDSRLDDAFCLFPKGK